MLKRLNTLLVAILAIGVVACGGQKADQPAAEKEMAKPEAPALVSAEWLKTNLEDPNVLVLDVNDEEMYAQGHIPGAVNSYIMESLYAKINNVAAELKPMAEVQTLLQSLGINNETHVIVCWPDDDQSHIYWGVRAYFALDNHGVKVSILDGGLKAWKAEAYPVETEAVTPVAGNVVLKPFNTAVYASAEDVKVSTSLFDLRGPTFFKGEEKHKVVSKAGTIKGAKNLPYKKFMKEDWTFKSPEQLKALLAENMIGSETIYFCNAGNVASIGWFVSEKLTGLKGTRVYDGSMNEWANMEGAELDNYNPNI